MTRKIALMACTATLVALPIAALLAAGPQPVTIRPGSLPLVRETDDRFQSFQIGFSHLTGGETWKAFDAMDGKPGGSIADVREARAPIDLNNRRLRSLTAALAPLYLRYSGTTANTVYFQDNDDPVAHQPPKGYKVVLTRARWKAAMDFARDVDAKVTTSFAIGDGVRDAAHNWTPAMAVPWMNYTRALGYSVYAAELFNEPNAPEYPEMPKGYAADQFARDQAAFRAAMTKVAPQTKLAGPGNATLGVPGGETLMQPTPEAYVAASPKPKFDIVSYHFYPVISQRCQAADSLHSITQDKALDEAFLARPDKRLQSMKALRDANYPGAPIWLTETGGAACGGLEWQQRFLDAFRYLDTSARLAKGGLDAIFTHALISGSNGVIDEKTFQPNASYWGAVLWRRLMGSKVLDAGANQPGLHLYAHCQRGVSGGVTLLAINLDKTAKSLKVSGPAQLYALTNPDMRSKTALLNGTPLALRADDTLPAMDPVAVKGSRIDLAPTSISFVTLPKAANKACGLS